MMPNICTVQEARECAADVHQHLTAVPTTLSLPQSPKSHLPILSWPIHVREQPFLPCCPDSRGSLLPMPLNNAQAPPPHPNPPNSLEHDSRQKPIITSLQQARSTRPPANIRPHNHCHIKRQHPILPLPHLPRRRQPHRRMAPPKAPPPANP